MKHLHFGAGRLGLGLVATMAHEAGLTTIIYNRETTASKAKSGDEISPKRRNELLSQKPRFVSSTLDPIKPNATKISFKEFRTYNSESSPDEFAQPLSTNEPWLVTASLIAPEAYDFPAAVVAEAAKARMEMGIAAPIYLMAFENEFKTDLFEAKVKEATERNHPEIDQAALPVVGVNIMADRICTSLDEVPLRGGVAARVC